MYLNCSGTSVGFRLSLYNPQHLVSFPLVGDETFEHCLLKELIHLFFRMGIRPLHGPMKFFDGTRRHLNLAVAGFAALQGLDAFLIEREILQVGKLGRIAEFTDYQVSGKLAKAVEITRKLEITFRRGIDVDCAEHEDLSRSAGMQSPSNSLSAADGCNLVITESDIVPEIGV